MKTARISLAALALSAVSAPGAAQVRVVVDGRVQQVPAGVIRVISWQPGGRQTIRDEPFPGEVSPGAATITTVETTEEDDRGRPLSTTNVTRIEPIRTTARAARPTRVAAWSPAPAQAEPVPMPSLPLDLDTIEPSGRRRAAPQVLRIRRDPGAGHFITTIRINGVPVRAIVDTGAANTILSPADARATGADGEIVSAQRMVGIGGYTMLNIARIRSLEVGGQELGGFTTPVGQAGLGFTLLGQSEIARLGRIVIEDGVMTITPRAMQITSR